MLVPGSKERKIEDKKSKSRHGRRIEATPTLCHEGRCKFDEGRRFNDFIYPTIKAANSISG